MSEKKPQKPKTPEQIPDDFYRRQLMPLAGEYRVASEIIRHLKVLCSVTYGNAKGTDLILLEPITRKALIIEVKTGSRDSFLTGFFTKYPNKNVLGPNYWVFYYQGEDCSKDEFYILTHEEVSIEQGERNKPGLTWEQHGERVKEIAPRDNVTRKDLRRPVIRQIGVR